MKDNYLRFVSLRLQDYKVFRGLNDFRFNSHQTLIIGNNGTGKTVIAEALENSGYPKRSQKTLTTKDRTGSSVAVITDGNSELIKKYRNFIFLSGDSARDIAVHPQDPILKSFLPSGAQKIVAGKTRTFFQSILSQKPWKIEAHRNLNTQIMSAGEKICFGFAFIFAIREALKLDIPLVLDSPYGRLDQELRQGFHNFLKVQPCQQILLISESEILEKESHGYFLLHAEESSHVMKL